MFLFGATRGGGVFAGTIRMKKETCIYLILPKGEEFWDSWILYFLVEDGGLEIVVGFFSRVASMV